MTSHRILSVASECFPLVKTGGLADVVGSLPQALEALGRHTRVLLPAYRDLLTRFDSLHPVWEHDDLFGGRGTVLAGRHDGLDMLMLDAPHLFDRPGGPYSLDGHDHPDNHVRFAALSWVGARLAIDGTGDGWRPDVVHAHDWQAGLAPSYLRYAGSPVPTVLTIHNAAFQGVFGADQLDAVRLPTWDFTPESLEYHGLVSSLKAGMAHAWKVTTVSATYARQLTTPEVGFGLAGVAADRAGRGDLSGIVNGIDTAVWNPEDDPHIVGYSASSTAGKEVDRKTLLEEFGLTEPRGPLAVVVSRLTHQKGIDLLIDALPGFLEAGGAAIVLGTGDPRYEHDLTRLADRYPGAVGVRIGYDEALSHRIYAGGDLVAVPSRFEPCGLTQLYGLRYGTLPLVAATGGLRDTVTDASAENRHAGTATGFTFDDISADGLAGAFARALELYADRPAWERVRARGMATPVDWHSSAQEYARLFDALVA
ncbi:MAG: glycogen synthase GlgA [Gordonia sp. (in: high G+C Gram-positive bacteria)]|uniref:glycogen synthase GlgA n=1 Tax=Gordonia sp. (in: high G+C Gram-positive bacteria) TaxID=84139 RepID=UPI0039E5CE39